MPAKMKTLQVPRQSDTAIINCLKKINETYTCESVSIETIGGIFKNLEEFDMTLISHVNSSVIDRLTTNIKGCPIEYNRGGFALDRANAPKSQSPYFDEIGIRTDIGELTAEDKLKISGIFSDELNTCVEGRGIGDTDHQMQLNAIQNATLEKIASVHADLLKETQKYRVELDIKQTEKEKELNDNLKSLTESLENEYMKKQELLDAKQDDLNKAIKEHDDRSNTHARREIRKDILSEIKNRQNEFKLTKGTINLRYPIMIILFLFISFLGFNVWVSGGETYHLISTSSDKTGLILLTGFKQMLYAFGLIGTVIFFIKWLNNWHEKHAVAEFKLKQFELDMERASWLVETSLEWKDAKGTTIPEDLLDKLSNNLFDLSKESHDKLVHPADQLASALLGSSTSIELKAGDSLIKVDPKKLSKVKPQ